MIISSEMISTETYSSVAEAENVLRKDETGRIDKCTDVIDTLFEILREYNHRGWDGANAEPVSIRSFRNALNFVLYLPEEFPCPLTGVGADGKITLEWRREDGRLFSLAFDNADIINYFAFMHDGEVVWGTRPVYLGYSQPFMAYLGKVY